MALYDDILPDSAKRKYSSNVYDNKVAGNRTNSRYSDSGTSTMGGTVNELAANLENNDGPMKGFTLETDDDAPTNTCKINTAGDDWGHLMDDDGKAIVTTKDAFCRTSYFAMDRGVQVYQGYDWYFPVVKSGYYGCIQCNADVGCANCFSCYNVEYTGESCPSGCYGACTSGCTAGCTSGCTAGCTASETAGCTEGCTTACTASCVSGCTTACTDCDGSEYTWENPDTGETCEGCDSCTSCDSCDGCVGDEVSEDTPENPFHCENCADDCFSCNADCNSCTACTSCNGDVGQQECRNNTSCTSACTNGCTTGCTANCTANCTSNVCGGCDGSCQNNQNGMVCKLVVIKQCHQGVTCDGSEVSALAGCKISVTCTNNNAEIYECTSRVSPCKTQDVDYEVCTLLTTGATIQCSGNCNTAYHSSTSGPCILIHDVVTVGSVGDPTCDSCVEACTACNDGCNASCDGACTGCDVCDSCVGCVDGCAACDGCTTGCFGSCTSGCAGGCTASCVGSCTTCTGCASQTGCSGCTGGCTAGCTAGCTSGCTSSCTGCDGCTTGCTSGCTGGCVTGSTSSPCAGGCISCVGCIGGYV